MVDILYATKNVYQLEECLEEAFELWAKYTEQERIDIVNAYVNQLYIVAKRRPTSDRLDELADFILVGELKNPHPDKVARTEYPFFSETQVKRRKNKTVLSDDEATIDYLNMKYNTWKNGGSSTHVHKKITTDKRS